MAEACGENLGCAFPQPNFGVEDVENNNDYLLSPNAAKQEIIITADKKLYVQECMSKLFFPSFWDVEEVQRVETGHTTSTFLTLQKGDAGGQHQRHVHGFKDEHKFGEVSLEHPNTYDVVTEEVVMTNDVKKQITSIEVLPNELLEYIFSFLDIKQRIRSELVCKRWRLIGKELPWRNVLKLCFVYLPKVSALCTSCDLSASVLNSVLSRCGSCLEQILLSIHYNFHTLAVSQKLVRTIVQYCPGLVAVELNLRVTNSCLATLANGCPKLKWLNIRCFSNDCNAGMLCIARQCENLETLALFSLPNAGNFLDFVNPRLQKLHLTYCTLRSTAMNSLMNTCNNLQELALSSCSPVDQTQLFEVCERYQQSLKVLRFHRDCKVENFNWCQGLQCLRNLEELRLGACTLVDDSLMEVLANNCPRLRSLGISGTLVTDSGLSHLNFLHGLKVLDISMNQMLGNGLEVLAKLGHLEKVYLDGTRNIREDSCCTLATNCPNFLLLHVTSVKNVTNYLVNMFCISKKNGYLKQPVQLFVGNTNVTENVETCEGIDVIFGKSSANVGFKKSVRRPRRLR